MKEIQLVMPEIMKAMNITKRPSTRDQNVYIGPIRQLLKKINADEINDGMPVTEREFALFYLNHIYRALDDLFDGETMFEKYMEYFKYADWQYAYLDYFNAFHDDIMAALDVATIEWAEDYVKYGVLKPFPDGAKVEIKLVKYGKERILEGKVLFSDLKFATSLVQIENNTIVSVNWEHITSWT